MAMTAKKDVGAGKPKVVYDVKMPRYDYRQNDGKSMSVDRNRSVGVGKPPADCLANIRA
jgi:hypothetical protein